MSIPGIEAIALDPLIHFYQDFQQNSSNKCSFINGTAEKMPLTDNSVDFCICLNAIDHMQSPDEALGQIRRVLKTGGKLCISCSVFNRWSRPLFPLFNLLDTPHPHHFTKSSFSNMLRKNKFKIDLVFPTNKIDIQSLKGKIGKIFGFEQVFMYCSIREK